LRTDGAGTATTRMLAPVLWACPPARPR
jgi:hypothetical protein